MQTGRRGGDGQPGQRGHAARLWLEDWAVEAVAGRLMVPHLHADKPGGTTGE